MTRLKFIRFVAVLLVLAMMAGLVVSPVSAGDDYWVSLNAINVTSWHDMAKNITNIRDNMIPSNISMVIDAATLNQSTYKQEISKNATTIMEHGSDGLGYNLTDAFAQIFVNGGQSLNFTTPTAGTYLILADIHESIWPGTTPVPMYSEYALCDANGTAFVSNTERMGTSVDIPPSNLTAINHHFSWIYTNATGPTTIGVCGKINELSDGPWFVNSSSDGRSMVSYVRLP